MPERRQRADGSAYGSVLTLLRLEALAVFLGAVIAYHALGGRWLWFAALFLAPDLSFLGYLFNPRVGAGVYDLAHTYVTPAVLLGVGAAMRSTLVPFAALIWIAHIAFDRSVGYGLKYESGFGHTHLGPIGPARRI